MHANAECSKDLQGTRGALVVPVCAPSNLLVNAEEPAPAATAAHKPSKGPAAWRSIMMTCLQNLSDTRTNPANEL